MRSSKQKMKVPSLRSSKQKRTLRSLRSSKQKRALRSSKQKIDKMKVPYRDHGASRQAGSQGRNNEWLTENHHPDFPDRHTSKKLT